MVTGINGYSTYNFFSLLRIYNVDRFLKAIAWLRVEHDKGEDKGQQSQL
jgi:hypothetical protein